MQITQAQFNILLKRYALEKKAVDQTMYESALIKAIEFIESAHEQQLFDLIPLCAENPETYLEYQAERIKFHQFLNAVLSPSDNNKNEILFNPAAAASAFKTKSPKRVLAKVHADPRNLGIREKRAQNILNSDHWLTDSDLRHMLLLTGLKDRIKILPLDSPGSIGTELHFAKKNQANTNTPYTIPLLLNCGSTGASQGSHWICAVISVDPTKNTISYVIRDSMNLTPAKEDRYKRQIEEAIRFKDSSHQAYPDIRIIQEHCHIIGTGQQTDGYSCGYRALHTLLNDDAIMTNNHWARRYKRVNPRNSNDLVQEMFDISTEREAPRPSERQYIQPIVQASSSRAPSSAHRTKREIVPLQEVIECIGSYQPNLPSLVFPKTRSRGTLDTLQYESLFEGLAGAIGLSNPALGHFKLAKTNKHTLAGLNAFYDNHQECTLFDTLTITIDLDAQSSIDDFVRTLQLSLSHLSRTHLNQLIIEDPDSKLSAQNISALLDFVKESLDSKPIGFNITLPKAYQDTKQQRDLDINTGINYRKNNQARLIQQQKAQQALPKTKVIRSRKEEQSLDPRAGLTVDVQMQAQLPAEASTQVTRRPVNQRQECNDAGLRVYRFEDLREAISSNDFSSFESPQTFGLTKKQFALYWHQLFGNILVPNSEQNVNRSRYFENDPFEYYGNRPYYICINAELNGISDEALAHCVEFKAHFQSGINIRQLPKGFLLLPDPAHPQLRILHYDEQTKVENLLAPKLAAPPKDPVLSLDVTQRLLDLPSANALSKALWEMLNQADEYQRDKIVLFRRHVLFLMRLTPDQSRIVSSLCGEGDGFNFNTLERIVHALEQLKNADSLDIRDFINQDKIQELFASPEDALNLAHNLNSNPTSQHPLFQLLQEQGNNALIRTLETHKLSNEQLTQILFIYDKYSSEGVNKLLRAFDEITSLTKIKANTAGYEALILSEQTHQAARTIDTFKKTQRQWWDKLYAAHQPIQDDVTTLLESFIAFSKAIEDQGLSFYELEDNEDLFKGASNLPTALGRMISILALCKKEHKAAQWRVMSRINLSAQGAIRALTDPEKCGFVSPEMNIDGVVHSNKGYNTVSTIQPNSNNLLQDFYRYIAHQEHTMPLAFYQQAVASLEAARKARAIPDESINLLYGILAEASSGDNCRYFINDTKSALTDWLCIIENIRKINITGFGDTIKRQLVGSLNQLRYIPSIYVLNHLIKVITSPLQKLSLKNINTFKSTQEKLLHNFRTLNDLLLKFGPSIYLGMRFYNDSDFQQEDSTSNLFERHLETCHIIKREGSTIDAIDEDFSTYTLWTPKLLALISTFSINPDDAFDICREIKQLTALLEDIERQEVQTAEANAPTNEEPLSPTSLSNTQTDEDNTDSSTDETDSDTQSIPSQEPKISRNEQRFIENCPQVIVLFALRYLEDISEPDGLTAKDLQKFIKSLSNLVRDYSHKYSPALLTEDSDLDIIEISSAIVNYEANSAEQRESLFSALKSDISQHVEQHFAHAFPQGYLERLRRGALRPRVSSQLKDQMKEMSSFAEPILKRFSDANEGQQIQLINQLSLLCQDLRPFEQEALLNYLSDERLLSQTSLEQYTQLLEALEQQGADAFSYFMRAARTQTQSDLALKAHYFLSEALPQIRSKDQAKLSEIESIDLSLDLILTAKPDELSTAFETENNLDKPYTDLLDSLNEISSENISEINRLITVLLSTDNTIEEIEHLKQEIVKKHASPTRSKSAAGNIISTVGVQIWNWLGVVTGLTNAPAEATSDSLEVPLDNAILKNATRVLEQKIKQLRAYHHPHTKTIALIEALLAQYPAAKPMLLSLTRHYLHLSEGDSPQVLQALAHIKLISEQLGQIKDEDIVLGICEHFSEDSPLGYKALLAIIKGTILGDCDFSNYPRLTSDAKVQVLKIITCLLNNDKPCSLSDIAYLVNQHSDEQHVATFKTLFQCAPYPSIDIIRAWLNTKPSTVLTEYTQWSKEPAPREHVNGFDIKIAREQAAKIEGIESSTLKLDELNEEVHRVKTLEASALLAEIKTIQNSTEPNKTQLLVLMAELLYRTKGLPAQGSGEERQWGRSFEINTTQYLALHAMLESGTHLTSQIATGEGKSRIMMIAIACQYALGQTVDFVTSDMSLATRDYLEYQAFFKALGAKTNLIYAQMPAEQYQQGGINFSDAENLSLFRNKARSEGQADLVIAKDPTKRCLLLDEADKTFFDSSDTRFNYSTQADAAIRDMPWIYEYMIEFFEAPARTELYYADADACNQAFIDFARSKGLDDKELARLIPNPKVPRQVITRNQLEAWQKAAITALTLEIDKDFIIKADVSIQTKTGPKTVSEAQLVIGGRASSSSKLSFGVHQCLHARLNRLRRFSGATPLESAVQALKHDFHVDSESQIVYSSTGKALIDDYAEGELLAVTGTMGSIQECIEAADSYSKSTQPMVFIEIPRHKRSKRTDLPVSITTGKAQQRHQILESIKASLKANQPVLLVCENDDESAELMAFLEGQLTEGKQKILTRISAKTSINEEQMHVNNVAGRPNSITISTAMLGRGTDISLHADAKNKGLHVIATYLPKERDYLQIIGRAGRFGAKGTSRLILDKTRVQKQVGEPLPTDFYTATEAYLATVHKRLDTQIQRHRVIKHHVGGIRLRFTNQFFNECYKPLIDAQPNSKEVLLNEWRVFFDVTDKLWNEIWPHIAVELTKPNCDINQINALLAEYEGAFIHQCMTMRDSLIEQIGKTIRLNEPNVIDINNVLQANTLSFALPLEQQEHLHIATKESLKTLKTIVADHYDPAYVGRAVIYKKFTDGLKAFFKNLASAYRGETLWFPNLQAAWNGNMSWRQFFFGGHSHEIEAIADEPNQSRSSSYRNMFGVFGTTFLGKESENETDAEPAHIASAPGSSNNKADASAKTTPQP